MDEFYREQRSGPGRQLLDLLCVALLGLILTLAAGAISRAPAAGCETPAKPDQTVAAALPLPPGATIEACADGEKPAGDKPAAPAGH